MLANTSSIGFIFKTAYTRGINYITQRTIFKAIAIKMRFIMCRNVGHNASLTSLLHVERLSNAKDVNVINDDLRSSYNASFLNAPITIDIVE